MNVNEFGVAIEPRFKRAPTHQYNDNYSYPLHDAARNYDAQELRRHLVQGTGDDANVNDRDEDGRTPLLVLLCDEFLGHLYETEMEECLQVLLLEHQQCDVNALDGTGESALSLAVLYNFQVAALTLVRNGADTAIRTSKFSEAHSLATKIAATMPEVMMEILDSGVTHNSMVRESGQPVEVTLDWRPLLQYSLNQDDGDDTSSLNILKAGRKKRTRKLQRETSFLYSLLDVPISSRSQYLTHPLISAFLHLRVSSTRWHLIIFQILLTVYPICYMVFIYFLYFDRCKFQGAEEDEEGEDENSTMTTTMASPGVVMDSVPGENLKQFCQLNLGIQVCAYLLSVVVVGAGLVECFMLLRIDFKYMKSWRSWVLRVSLVIMGVTLWPALRLTKDTYNISWQYPIAALGTFFAWVMFLLQMELIPQVKVYLEMLVTIILSVLKIILLFFPLFIGFYMGFSLLYDDLGGVMTFILMAVDVGNDEYEEMVDQATDSRKWFTVLGDTFSVAFIIVIAIVFMNFLLGVAINDIQELKRNAKIMSLSHRVQNVFIINLIFPYYYNVVKPEDIEGGNWTCTYQPTNVDCQGRKKFDDQIRLDITLLLKSKKDALRPRQSSESDANCK